MIVIKTPSSSEVHIDGSFLGCLKTAQAKREKGCYGWYVIQNGNGSKKIWLYIGTVKERPTSSVISRCIGELCGPQVSSNKGRSVDTDFAMSVVISHLAGKGIDVYWEKIDNKDGVKVEILHAKEKDPRLQNVTDKTVRLKRKFKPNIECNDVAQAITEICKAVDELERRVSPLIFVFSSRRSPHHIESTTNRLIRNFLQLFVCPQQASL